MEAALLDYYRAHREQHLEGLFELLRIPSVSALPAHRDDVRRAAEYLAADLTKMGMDGVRLIEGDGHPIVYGESLHAPGKPTLVLYGHYDVQPPDPLDEWLSPPFEPTVRDANVYARGAVDDKGQTYLILKAVEGLKAVRGELPINVKFLIEGEEETDGGVLSAWLAEHGSELGADAALICDTEMFAPGLPTITTGLRGMVYAEIEVHGSRTDLHSGMYGGVAPNAFQGLAQILCGLKGPDGRVLIPGFYDDVREPSAAELEAWAELPFDEDQLRDHEIGSSRLVGEPDYPPLHRIWARPTFEIHGMPGGFIGEGAKTVIPAKATAKVSMRLVPDMDPQRIADELRSAVAVLTPEGMSSIVRVLGQAPASLTSTDSVYIEKAAEAMSQSFGRPTVYQRSGGSIPVVGLLQESAGIPSVMMGFGLPDDNLHAPNEKFHLPNFYAGIETVGRYLSLLGE